MLSRNGHCFAFLSRTNGTRRGGCAVPVANEEIACVCVCLQECPCVCTCASSCACILVHVYVCTDVSMCVIVCDGMCEHARLCAHVMVCGYSCVHLCACVFTCTRLCAHELVCARLCVHTCVHVHTWVAVWASLRVCTCTQGRALQRRTFGAPLLRQQGQCCPTPRHEGRVVPLNGWPGSEAGAGCLGRGRGDSGFAGAP